MKKAGGESKGRRIDANEIRHHYDGVSLAQSMALDRAKGRNPDAPQVLWI
ncbi:MAG: hypothetical protein H8D75_01470 [Rhodospirillaceae bacterium]|nr:hypothetical protein [Rhodospirillaceae bacterium]